VKYLTSLGFACLLVCATLSAQDNSASGHTLVVIPFENSSPTPGLEWLGEAFSQSLYRSLDSPLLYVASREERVRAYERQGIPPALHPSRPTLYRIAEQMDVDYVALGSYSYDGATLTVSTQLLDMRSQKLLPAVTESAQIQELGRLQASLGWDVLRAVRPDFSVPRQRYIESAPRIRLDAIENYTRALMSSTDEDKIDHLKEAVRLNSSFPEAWLELGKACLHQRAYEQAATALANVPADSTLAREANFYLGVSRYARGDFDKAEQAFAFVAARLPLAEVYNNMGVVALRRDPRKAVEYFERAVQNDPSDEDYHFNLAIARDRMGDKAGATRELRLAVEARSTDAEARSLLDSLNPQSGSVVAAAAVTRMPALRLKRSYDENSFRQMTTQMQGWAEQAFSRSDSHSHARYHLELGKELLKHGFTTEAEAEFRHAAAVDSASPEPLTALAEVYDERGDSREARAQAEASLRMRESINAYLFLTKLDLRENRLEAAAQNINRAAQLEPRNPAVQEMKRALAARQASKGQP